MALPPGGADRTCVVTGASSGIGREIARELARRGLGVSLVARREDRLRDLANELRTETGVDVEIVPTDLTDPASRRGLVEAVADRGLSVDVLVNNAGMSTFGPVHRSQPGRELAVVATNINAVVDLCSNWIPGMVERGRGAVLNVASTAAFQPLPGQAGYAATKSFVLSYSQAIHTELRGTGVAVTVLCPGPVHTEFGASEGLDEKEASDALPKFMWLPAEDVARTAVDGLAHGRPVVIPGIANKVSAAGGHLLPRRLLLPIIARQHFALREPPDR
jgi:short-subunit dehydrogenase